MVVFSSIISAISTVVIAYFAWRTHKMYKLLQKEDNEYKEKTHDLYQAIVISNVLCSVHGIDFTIRRFNEEYKGKTPIFD